VVAGVGSAVAGLALALALAVLALPALALGDTDPVPAMPGTTTVPSPSLGSAMTQKALSWSLVGVASDGRGLLVRPGTYGGCDQGPPVVSLTETATSVAVAVTVRTPADHTVICPQIAVLPPTQTVALKAPIAGRAVTGPQRSTRPGSAYLDAPPAPATTRAPRVIGLRAADARSVLCAWGLRAKPGAGRGMVVAQTPAAGRATSRPTAPPTTCRALRATVTLHTR
jgi:hypothetical protein